MWQVRTNQHEVTIVILPDMIANEALASRVQRQGQFELGMMMPLEGNGIVQTPIQAAKRALRFLYQFFEIWPHPAPAFFMTPE